MPDASSPFAPPDLPPSPLAAAMVRFRDALAAGYAAHPELELASIDERRRVAEAIRAPWAAGGPVMHDSRDHELVRDGHVLRLRVHRPVAEPDGVLLYLHGGGWTLFSLDTHDRLMREYAARTGFAVVGLDYSLVPEVRFPVPVEEAVAAVRLLRASDAAAVLGFDPAPLPLAVGGDSAGGNLALATAVTLRDAGQDRALSAVLLNYAAVMPPGDPAPDSYALFDGPKYNLSAAEMRAFWDGYCPDPASRLDPRCALLRGPLGGLPPILLHVAECDVLRDENLLLAGALRAAGTPVRAVTWPGALHSFLEAVSVFSGSVEALDDAGAWLRRTLQPDR